MQTTADRFRTVAADFTARVQGVPPERWDSPAPCEGWVARDIVRHLVEWVPGFLSTLPGIDAAIAVSVDDDPLAAWVHVRDLVQRILDDPKQANQVFSSEMVGEMPAHVAIDRFILGDVLVHTWDLARATGQDETIDATEAERMFTGMEPMAEVLAESTHFGPRTPVPDDAPIQDKLIALTGRTP